MSNPANFPPVTPIDRPNQYQKNLFPFDSFAADDPNVTAVPTLTLASPWQMSGTFKGTGTALLTSITGTAAALSSSNPVLLLGQIGYETDTLSFKIGDGSTAYNTLTYFYRGLLVAGEPSLGTPHPTSDANRTATLVVNTSTNTAGVWSAAVTMTGAPVGAKAAWCYCAITNGAYARLAVEAATGYTLSDITSGTNWTKYWGISNLTTGGGQDQGGVIKIHLDANKQFKWCTGQTNLTVKIGSAIDYDE